jgi:hypothetical protein
VVASGARDDEVTAAKGELAADVRRHPGVARRTEIAVFRLSKESGVARGIEPALNVGIGDDGRRWVTLLVALLLVALLLLIATLTATAEVASTATASLAAPSAPVSLETYYVLGLWRSGVVPVAAFDVWFAAVGRGLCRVNRSYGVGGRRRRGRVFERRRRVDDGRIACLTIGGVLGGHVGGRIRTRATASSAIRTTTFVHEPVCFSVEWTRRTTAFARSVRFAGGA